MFYGPVLIEFDVPFEWIQKRHFQALKEQKLFFTRIFFRLLLILPIIILSAYLITNQCFNVALDLINVILYSAFIFFIASLMPLIVFKWFPQLIRPLPYKIKMRKRGLFKSYKLQSRLLSRRKDILSYFIESDREYSILSFNIRRALFIKKRLSFAFNPEITNPVIIEDFMKDFGLPNAAPADINATDE